MDIKRLELQNKEFDALTDLAKEWETLKRIAVVDDDYPYYRQKYEWALKTFIEACNANRKP
jgi:hypothetical protein